MIRFTLQSIVVRLFRVCPAQVLAGSDELSLVVGGKRWLLFAVDGVR